MDVKSSFDKVMNVLKSFEELLSEDDSVFLEMERAIQIDHYSCGVQATYSILKYYGRARSIPNIEKLLNAYNRGYTSESSIYKLLRERKLKISKRNNANFSSIKESIDEYEAPMLSTINDGDHWIVIYGYSPKSIFVLDSAPISVNLKKLSLEMKPFVKWDKEKFKTHWDKWGAIVYQ